MHNISNRASLKGLGESEREILSALAALEQPTLSVDEVLDLFDLSRQAANLMLSRLARKGWLRRLRRGVYTIVPLSSSSSQPVVENPLTVAMRLFKPCYISGWTAAEHWDLTEQIHNVVVVYSSTPQRKSIQEIGGVKYRIRRVPEETIFGTIRLWYGRVPVQMASPERMIIDILNAPEMGGGSRQTLDIVRAYWRGARKDPENLMSCAEKLGRGSVFKRLGFTAELFGDPDPGWTDRCLHGLTKGIALLDPSGPRGGQTASRWRLRINIPLEDGS